MSALILKHAPIGDNEDDYDVLADGKVVGRIFVSQAAPQDRQWMWTIAYGHHEDRTPTRGYEPTSEVAMAAFAKAGGGSERRRRSALQCGFQSSLIGIRISATSGFPRN